MNSLFLRSLLSQKRIAGGAFILAVTQFGASLAGLLRDRILSATFPPGVDQLDTVSVYIAAFRPSDLMFQMVIMSAFSVALVPMLASHFAHGREEEMDRLLSSVLVIAMTVFGVLGLCLGFTFHIIAPLLVNFEGESLALYVHFGRIALLTNALFVIGNAFGQYLIVRQTYWSYGLTPILYTLGTILGTVWLTTVFGSSGPIYGSLIGAVIYTLIRLISCIRLGFVPRRSETLIHSEIREMGWLMLPRMAALGAMQVQLLLFDMFASGMPLGSVTINAYARNFQSALVGIVGIALAQSVYSLLSQAIARGDNARYWSILHKGTLLALALTIPGAIALSLLSPVAATIVHLTEPVIVHTFTIALGFYAISVPLESLNHLLLRACYATKHTMVPALFTVIDGIIAILVAWQFAPFYGVYALAVGFGAGQAVQVLGLWMFLKRRTRLVY